MEDAETQGIATATCHNRGIYYCALKMGCGTGCRPVPASKFDFGG